MTLLSAGQSGLKTWRATVPFSIVPCGQWDFSGQKLHCKYTLNECLDNINRKIKDLIIRIRINKNMWICH